MRPWRPLLLCLTLAACGAQPGAEAAPGPIAGGAITATVLDAPAEAVAATAPVPDAVDTDVPLAAIAALPGPAPLVTEAEATVAAEPAEALATAGALPETPPDGAREPAEPLSRAAAACAARGGVFSSPADGGARACVRRTGDGGKTCRVGNDCQGQCLARSGTCAPIDPLLGCNEILQDDGSRVTLCLD